MIVAYAQDFVCLQTEIKYSGITIRIHFMLKAKNKLMHKIIIYFFISADNFLKVTKTI